MFGAAAAGVAAVVGLGGWGAYALLSGAGSQPADAIPSTAVAYVSLDLDPSAEQKIEALKILNKFPAVKDRFGLSAADDLRRVVFDEMQSSGVCKDLDYDRDVRPWIGERLAVAVVPSEARPGAAPVVALQVSDRGAAAAGIAGLARCSPAGDDFGFAFSGDYLLVTDSDRRAEALAAAAAEDALGDDADFLRWTGAAGDAGIVTMYAAADAPRLLMDIRRDLRGGARMQPVYPDFEGLAVTIRVDDGAVEAELAGQWMPAGLPAAEADAGPNTAALPASTAAAFSVALPDGWLGTCLEQMAGMLGDGRSTDQLLAEAEAETGLNLPEDIATLFGDGFSLSVDSGIDARAALAAGDPGDLPIGLLVSGNPGEILPVFEKVKRAIGPDADKLIGAAGDGVVAFGANREYLDTLLAGGTLGDEESFRRVLPSAGDASGVLYVDFDAGDGWLARLAGSVPGFTEPHPGGPGENLAPLDALGVSTWADGDVQRGLLRLTTD